MLKAEYDNYLQTETFTITEKNAVECSLNLSEDNADKILSLTGKVYQATVEKEGDTLIYGGLAVFNVVFSGDELMRTEVGAKFSFKTPVKNMDGAAYNVSYALSNVRTKADGGSLYATADLFTEITYDAVKENACLTDTDALKKTGVMQKFTSKAFCADVEAEDAFDAAKTKRILFSDANAIVKSATAAEGAVIVEGNVVISVLSLPFSENGDIIKEQRTFPFRFECEADGAEEGMRAFADVEVDKLSLKVYVDEQKNTSSVTAKTGLSIHGEVIRCDEQEYVEDCYSPDTQLSLSHASFTVKTAVKTCCFSDRTGGIANCTVPEYSRLIKLFGETVETAGVTLNDGTLTVDGLIEGTAVFAGEENALTARAYQLPFTVTTRTDAEKVGNVKVVVEDVSGRMRNGKLDVEAGVIVSFAAYEEHAYDVISGFAEGDKKDNPTPAISVYLGAAGDTEWEVTKMLGVAAEDILEQNPALKFPLVGGERVTVYRKLR